MTEPLVFLEMARMAAEAVIMISVADKISSSLKKIDWKGGKCLG